MTAEEIVLGGYASYVQGDMEALGSIYHPECKITLKGNHALSGVYIVLMLFTKEFYRNSIPPGPVSI